MLPLRGDSDHSTKKFSNSLLADVFHLASNYDIKVNQFSQQNTHCRTAFLQNSLLDAPMHRNVLDQLYEPYVRPHLDYGDAIYHTQNLHLMSKFESTQYDAALAVRGAWRGTSTDKVLKELGWETLAHKRYYRRLCQFYKIVKNSCPEYLRTHLPERTENPYNLRRHHIFFLKSVLKQTVTQTASIHIVSRPGIISTPP